MSRRREIINFIIDYTMVLIVVSPLFWILFYGAQHHEKEVLEHRERQEQRERTK